MRKQSQQHAQEQQPLEQTSIHTEAGMLSGISRKHNMRSSSCRFTEFCNSQCLSHFAAPFIVDRTETSIAESCEEKLQVDMQTCLNALQLRQGSRNEDNTEVINAPPPSGICMKGSRHILTQTPTKQFTWCCRKRANDPSAGSPTETLLRLLLPLSDKVHQTFHCNVRDPNIAAVRIIHRITQSVGATGGVYKGQGRNQHELMTRAY